MPNTILNYIKESKAELKKVQWPTRQEVVQGTIVVVAISLGTAAFLGVVDYLLNSLLEVFI